ncbi:MAG: hypothetical protein ACK4RV_05340 [Caulobacter sp.]
MDSGDGGLIPGFMAAVVAGLIWLWMFSPTAPEEKTAGQIIGFNTRAGPFPKVRASVALDDGTFGSVELAASVHGCVEQGRIELRQIRYPMFRAFAIVRCHPPEPVEPGERRS